MIILFGSYATGEYVHLDRYEENGIIYEYKSDYDLLIILSANKQANTESFFGMKSVSRRFGGMAIVMPGFRVINVMQHLGEIGK